DCAACLSLWLLAQQPAAYSLFVRPSTLLCCHSSSLLGSSPRRRASSDTVLRRESREWKGHWPSDAPTTSAFTVVDEGRQSAAMMRAPFGVSWARALPACRPFEIYLERGSTDDLARDRKKSHSCVRATGRSRREF